MSVSLSAAAHINPTLTPHEEEVVVARSTADFPPGFWGDAFLSCLPHDDKVTHECTQKQIEELKEEVRKELKAAVIENNIRSPELLKLIDSIQLLGVAYHFESEIEEALKQMCQEYAAPADEDLTTSSLRFRLLRQGGYRIPADVFNKFKDEEGKFRESLIGDIHGMLALYEASHLMVNGEDILEEALAFTIAHLQSVASDRNNPLSERVIHALQWPIRKGLTRVVARHYISFYQEGGSCNNSLLKLAKLDFSLLQSLHRKELLEISRWWKSIDLERKLPFARNRLGESYIWSLAVFFEPQYFPNLRFLTKVIAILTIIDDTYDAYGTIEELEALTEVVERWDASCIDQLHADYLKLLYRTLLDLYEETEEEMINEGNSYRIHYAKEAMKKIVRSYFMEAKWLNQGYQPTFDEYMSNALVSSAHTSLFATFLVGMGEVATEEAFQWVLRRPEISRASELIGRVMNDIVAHEFEQRRNHIPSSVECYMKQYGVTKEEAYVELKRQVVRAWKDINEGCPMPTHVPMSILNRILEFTRVEDVVYKDADEFTHAGKWMKDLVDLMLIDPVPI